MSCSPQLPREQSDSSDYGSDFSPEEDELLNELLAQAIAENATIHPNATPTSTSTSTPIPTAVPVAHNTNGVLLPDPSDIETLQPATLAALVADIEDGIENAPGVRLPKVLGREKPRSPWRQSSQGLWVGPQAARGSADRASPGPNNRSSPLGKDFFKPGATLTDFRTQADSLLSEAFSGTPSLLRRQRTRAGAQCCT
jgi:exonuclease V